MAKRQCRIIQTTPIPQGGDSYEHLRASVVQELKDSIPEEYYLDESIFDNPQLDITSIPSACGILTPEELEITEKYDAVGLAQAIATRKYKAVTVSIAFCKRAAIAHQLTCCLTQFFMSEATERAKFLDDYLEKNGKPIGPLHGVPISVKEHMNLRDRPSSYGFISSISPPAKDDCLLVSTLRSLGAVFYVKTNQPQAIMHLETDSFLGRTLNPYNINLSAGGSSGGEAALVALRGSVMGLGTDIGGSIRGPAGFSGIHGFKPTSYTVSTHGMSPGGFPAELNVLGSTGPLCNSLRDVDFFMSLVLGSKQYLHDPSVIPIPWTGLSTPLPEAPLKVGIMFSDGAITPQPPVLRALKWAQGELSKPEFSSMFEVKSYTPFKSAEGTKFVRQLYWPEGDVRIQDALGKSGEPMFPLTQHGLRDVDSSRQKTATEIADMRLERDNFRCEFAEHWNAQDVDFVICPVFYGPAGAHDTSFYWNYTALWNLVDYPGIVVPAPIKAEKEKEKYADDAKDLSEESKHVRQLWEETDFVGAPIDLQVVARKYHDNELMACVGRLQKALRFA